MCFGPSKHISNVFPNAPSIYMGSLLMQSHNVLHASLCFLVIAELYTAQYNLFYGSSFLQFLSQVCYLSIKNVVMFNLHVNYMNLHHIELGVNLLFIPYFDIMMHSTNTSHIHKTFPIAPHRYLS